MKYFIGIAPPDAYLKKVTDFQLRWESNVLPHRVEPHITVKSTAAMTEDLHWLESVKEFCSKTPCFEMTLGKPEWFGKTVLLLSVQSPELFNIHQSLVDIVNPAAELRKQHFEENAFHAHLTLGNAKHGISFEELKDMEQQAISELQPYPTFKVSELFVYRAIEDAAGNNIYSRYATLPLQP